MMDVILLAVIAIAVFFVVRREIKRISRGRFCSHCSGCSSCGAKCGQRKESACGRAEQEESGD